MKTTLLYLSSAILFGFGLSSCVMPDDPAFATGYSSGGYGYGAPSRTYISESYYNDDDFYYYDGASPYYGSRPYGSYSVGYSYYRGRSLCPICHHNPCTGHNGRPSSSHGYSSAHHNDHDNDRDDHHSSNGPTLFRHLSADRNPGAPQGLHSKDWYKDHGYGMSRLSPVISGDHDDHHSSSHNDHDDDDKHHKSSHHDDDDKHHKH